jgi:hypothetical protein
MTENKPNKNTRLNGKWLMTLAIIKSPNRIFTYLLGCLMRRRRSRRINTNEACKKKERKKREKKKNILV